MKKDTTKVSAAVVAKSVVAESKGVVARLRKLEIVDERSYDLAGEKLQELREWDRIAEEKENSIIIPLNKAVKEVRALFAPFRETVKGLIAEKKSEMLLYLGKVKSKQKKLDKQFDDGKIGTRAYVTGTGKNNFAPSSTGLRKIWTAIPVDVKKTPREYLEPNITKIREALKDGKKVAGWKYEQVDNITL